MTGFDDLEDAANNQQDSDTESDANATTGETTTPEVQAEAAVSTESSTGDSTNTDEEGLESPAFAFDETSQEQIYPREAVYTEYEDFVDFELKRELRDRGVRNVSGREVDDALLRFAMDDLDGFAEYVEQARR